MHKPQVERVHSSNSDSAETGKAITLAMFQWLLEVDALESRNVTFTDPQHGLLCLSDDSMKSLRDGTRVIRLLQNCLPHKEFAQEPTEAKIRANDARSRMSNWLRVSNLFRDLTGFELPDERRELMMCGDDEEIFSLLHQVRRVVDAKGTASDLKFRERPKEKKELRRVGGLAHSLPSVPSPHVSAQRVSLRPQLQHRGSLPAVSRGAPLTLPPPPAPQENVCPSCHGRVKSDAHHLETTLATAQPQQQHQPQSPLPPSTVEQGRSPKHEQKLPERDVSPRTDDATSVAVQVTTKQQSVPRGPKASVPAKSKLVPFIIKVMLIQTFIRWLWSSRCRLFRLARLRAILLLQARYRYSYCRPRGTTDDRDRYPLLKGQCTRCLPIISSFRDVLISTPTISQKRVAKYIAAACWRCRTLMNSMERWRPGSDEGWRLKRERVARIVQALMRIKISVRVRAERQVRLRSFPWSTETLIWRIVPFLFRLQRQRIVHLWVLRWERTTARIYTTCKRCMPLQLALFERSRYCRKPVTMEKYLKLMCPDCHSHSMKFLAGLQSSSMKMLGVAIRAMLALVRWVNLHRGNPMLQLVMPKLLWSRSLARRRQIVASVAQCMKVADTGGVCARCVEILHEFFNFILQHREIRSFDKLKSTVITLKTVLCEACRVRDADLRQFVLRTMVHRSLMPLYLVLHVFHFAFMARGRSLLLPVPKLECQRCLPFRQEMHNRFFFDARRWRRRQPNANWLPYQHEIEWGSAWKLCDNALALRFCVPLPTTILRHEAALCTRCRNAAWKSLRQHICHRWLNWIVRVVVSLIFRWRYRMRHRKSTLTQQITSCSRCNPLLVSLSQRIRGQLALHPVSHRADEGIFFPCLTAALFGPYSELCCQQCAATVLYRAQELTNSFWGKLATQKRLNFARIMIAAKMIVWKLRRREVKQAADVIVCPSACERCAPISQMLQRRLNGVYFDHVEAFAPWGSVRQRHLFSPASYFKVMCISCAANHRNAFHRFYKPQIIKAHRAVIRCKGRFLRCVLRRRAQSQECEDCARCTPIFNVLYKAIRQDSKNISVQRVAKYIRAIPEAHARCREQCEATASLNLHNREWMLWAQGRLRWRILRRFLTHCCMKRSAPILRSNLLRTTNQVLALWQQESERCCVRCQSILEMFVVKLGSSSPNSSVQKFSHYLPSDARPSTPRVARYTATLCPKGKVYLDKILRRLLFLWRWTIFLQTRHRWRRYWAKKQFQLKCNSVAVSSTNRINRLAFGCPRCANIVELTQVRVLSRSFAPASDAEEEKRAVNQMQPVLCRECAPQATKWVRATLRYRKLALHRYLRWKWLAFYAKRKQHIAEFNALCMQRNHWKCARCWPIAAVLARKSAFVIPAVMPPDKYSEIFCADCRERLLREKKLDGGV